MNSAVSNAAAAYAGSRYGDRNPEFAVGLREFGTCANNRLSGLAKLTTLPDIAPNAACRGR
jgi:hypothetical protein